MRSLHYANPADDPEAHAFLRSLAAKPGDQLPRLIFADWLEDRGYHNAAAGQRWAADKGKYPKPPSKETQGSNYMSGGWWPRESTGHEFAGLPEHVYDALPGDSHFLRGGDSTFRAERGFLHAAHTLSYHPETGEPLPPEARD
jgi:uncharacterized protein (TIGR02996 family)